MRVLHRTLHADALQAYLNVEQLFVSGQRMHSDFMNSSREIEIENKATGTLSSNDS
mgnify:CR=1 FL=1|jgi:hypothetical protein